MVNSKKTLQTLKIDIWKGLLNGILQSGWQTFGLLVLIEVFLKPSGEKGEMAQALVFSSGFLGMLFSLFYVSLSQKFRLKKTTWVLFPTLVTAAGLVVSVFSTSTWMYVAVMGLAHFAYPMRLPFLTQIYHENYPEETRGTYHSYALVAMQISTIIFSYLAGLALEWDTSLWRWIFVIMSLAAFWAAMLLKRIPSIKNRMTPVRNPLAAFRWIWRDRVFGYILAVWFIFGFANLWIMPLRISYLSQEMALGPGTVTLIASVVPEIARLCFLPLWAKLFDRMNFIVVRMAMNSFFAMGIFGYFFADSLWGIGFSAFLHGVGFAGGRLAWALWITKMAPKSRSADYMAVHLALTGVRGFFGPMIGFWVLSQLPQGQNFQIMASVSSTLFLLSILLLIPVISQGRR